MKAEWTVTVPVISTQHVPNEEEFERLAQVWDFRVAGYREGAFVFVGHDVQNDKEPVWITALRTWVIANYPDPDMWVRFDADGDLIDELAKWEW